MRPDYADAVVIGGGFFGCKIALSLRRRGLGRVVVIERERDLLQRASYANQARVHNGYHYPRSLPTAARSHENFARFCDDHAYAIHTGMRKYYAIARDSRVNASQFERFCREIQAPLLQAPAGVAALFDDSLIAAVFTVTELAFDATALAQALGRELAAAGVELELGASARIAGASEHEVTVETTRGGPLHAGYVFNCTYAELDALGAPVRAPIKRELAELALIDPPNELRDIGVTVMDGPFFSTMPFPAERCHSLSHVRYTLHSAWLSHEQSVAAPGKSHAAFMQRDAARFLPCLARARLRRSLFEVKAVLAGNEGDDGRPILFEHSSLSPRIISVLGGKLDNIYDILALLDAGDWMIP